MSDAISTITRGARILSRPRRRDGMGVVAASSTAETVPIAAFAITAAITASPCSWAVSGPSAIASPPGRANGRKSAASSTNGATIRARLQTSAAGTRAAQA